MYSFNVYTHSNTATNLLIEKSSIHSNTYDIDALTVLHTCLDELHKSYTEFPRRHKGMQNNIQY
jgi:hypothetical protein